MFDKEKLTPDAKRYFDSLPLFLKESLTQTSVHLTTKEELINFCEHVQRKS